MRANRVLRYSVAICDVFFKYVYRARIYGVDNIPRKGPIIVAYNHVSYLDPPLVSYPIAQKRPFCGIGKKEVFDIPLFGAYLRHIGCFPVDRDKGDLGALRQCLRVLKNGDLLLMAPEGTRGTSGRSHTPKSGVSFIAHHAKVAIIPTYVANTSWPPIPGRVWMKYGKPIRFDSKDIKTKGRDAAYRDFAVTLMEHIYAMKEGED